MKRNIPLIIILVLIAGTLLRGNDPDQRFTLSGYIEDAASGEKLIGANVYETSTGSGTVSNLYGFYSITLPQGTYTLAFSYIGYQTQYFEVDLFDHISLSVKLPEGSQMETVDVVAERQIRFEERTQMSQISIPVRQIKQLPAFMGETDVLKALQLLPGVQSGNEGSSGLFVRGGSPDQNLILLDGVPVYNVSHLFGFFSVFNADALKSVTLTKGGFPARYGGRLSSVLEINMKEGNLHEIKGEGSIGLVSSRLTLEGPIIKERASFIVSGRRTYIDVLTRPFIAWNQRGSHEKLTPQYYFYDLNAKLNYIVNDRHRLFLSAYTGDDRFSARVRSDDPDTDDYFKLNAGLDWGNITSAFRWNYLWNPRLFSNVTLTYSRYRFNTGTEIEEVYRIHETEVKERFLSYYRSGINDWAAKVDFDFIPSPNHYVKFGAYAIHHSFNPGALQFELDFQDIDFDTLLRYDQTRAWEFAAFIEDDFKIGERIKTNIGIHASGFLVEDQPYWSVQPRLAVNFMLNHGYALKASFATMTQYIHMLTNEGIGLPTDLWVPSTARISPQQSWQVAAGVARTFGDGYEVSIEGYYKQMHNILSYSEGAGFLSITESWQDKVEQGKGEAYGAEFFVQKKTGKTTGWIGYTLSWSNRQFDNINSGKWYPFKYDRRHDIAIAVIRELNDRHTLSATWVFGTGNAISLPLATFSAIPYEFGEFFIPEIEVYGDKNAFRMRSYHRFDISLERKRLPGRWLQQSWSFGVYNLYSRKNPFFVYRQRDRQTGKNEFVQVSLFPLIPSISWNFNF